MKFVNFLKSGLIFNIFYCLSLSLKNFKKTGSLVTLLKSNSAAGDLCVNVNEEAKTLRKPAENCF